MTKRIVSLTFFSEYSDGIDESHPTSKLRYGSGGRRHYRPRPLQSEHWVDEDTADRLNGKQIIGHNEGIDEELNDVGAHPAGADKKILIS